MLTITEIEQGVQDYTVDLHNLHLALDCIGNQHHVPLDWIEFLSAVDTHGDFIPDAPFSMAYVIGLAAALDTGTLTREDIKIAYREALQTIREKRNSDFMDAEDLAMARLVH